MSASSDLATGMLSFISCGCCACLRVGRCVRVYGVECSVLVMWCGASCVALVCVYIPRLLSN